MDQYRFTGFNGSIQDEAQNGRIVTPSAYESKLTHYHTSRIVDIATFFHVALVYSREAMAWQMDHTFPHNGVKERIDEHADSVIKWPMFIVLNNGCPSLD